MCLREDVLRCVAMCGDVVACAGASCVPTVASDQGRAVASLVEECEQSSSERILIQQRSDLSTDNVFVAYGFFGFIGFFVSAEVMMAAC